MKTLLIATHNPGKIAEYQSLLADLSLRVISLAELSIAHQAEETGDTFVANARIKALTFAKLANVQAWADDSGLEVDALGGRPGVHSARYGGDGLTDRDRYRLLLDELQGVPMELRTARFRCAVCIAQPDGETRIVDGCVEGVIAAHPAGDNGFGYDPVFYLPDYMMTMAQLPVDLKNLISHRGQAAHAAKRLLAEQVNSQRIARPD